jgi:parallel beta helix pectate lyase-like protein
MYQIKQFIVRMFLVLTSVCFFSYIQPVNVYSAEYYVDSNSGNDTNDGMSSASAWERFSTSVSKLNDGDTLHLAVGIYNLENEGDPADNVIIGNSNISIIGDASGGSEINGTDFSDWVDGITIESNFDNIVIEHIKIVNFTRGIVIDDNCENVVIENCDIGPSSIYGIYIENCSPEIRNNTLVDNLTGIYVYGYMNATSPASPIITNNLIYEEGSNLMNYGIHVEGLATDGEAYPLIYHNTIDGGVLIGIHMNEDVSPIEPTIKYNIITNFGQYGVDYNGGNTPIVDFNYFFGNTLGNYSGDIIAGSNNITDQGDPLYADEDNHDYHLQNESLSIDTIPSTETSDDVEIDLEYNSRTFPKDMGCYEFQQGTPPANNLPATPTNESPSNFAVFADDTTSVTLESSAFSDPSDDTHTSTEWRVKREDRGVYNCDDYDASFNATYSTNPGLTSHSVSGLDSGMQYVWQVRYQNSNEIWSLWSLEYRFTVGTSAQDSSVQIEGGTDVASYRMVSFPLWPDNPACSAFFRNELAGAYNTTQLRLGTYNAETGSYLECGSNMTIKPGTSYWFLSRNDMDIDVSGIPVATGLDIDVGLDYNESTGNGWNMIACPNDADYDWSSVQVLVPDGSGGTIFGPTDISLLSNDNGYIDTRLWRWEDGSYFDDTQTMVHHEGYWVNTRAENVYLRFRADIAIADSGSNRTMVSKAFTRIKRWVAAIIDTRHAVASGETPPLPPGVHDEPETKNCFIHSITE